jgi:competence ComEA-like helix-hairpin-helix protein
MKLLPEKADANKARIPSDLFRRITGKSVSAWCCLTFVICLTTVPIFSQPAECINVNTASAEEISRLPGIGPGMAAQIVEHRHKHGRFKRAQDIIIVPRLSAKLYRQIAHLICI